jgi:hypothetical protein
MATLGQVFLISFYQYPKNPKVYITFVIAQFVVSVTIYKRELPSNFENEIVNI